MSTQNNQQNIHLWKAIAVGAALFYLYKLSKANGGTLENNPMGITVDSDKIIDLASHLLPDDKRAHVRHYGRLIRDKWNEVQNDR